MFILGVLVPFVSFPFFLLATVMLVLRGYSPCLDFLVCTCTIVLLVHVGVLFLCPFPFSLL